MSPSLKEQNRQWDEGLDAAHTLLRNHGNHGIPRANLRAAIQAFLSVLTPDQLLALAAKGMSQEEREQAKERIVDALAVRHYPGWHTNSMQKSADEALAERVLATLLPEAE